jgi:hypothetical protein
VRVVNTIQRVFAQCVWKGLCARGKYYTACVCTVCVEGTLRVVNTIQRVCAQCVWKGLCARGKYYTAWVCTVCVEGTQRVLQIPTYVSRNLCHLQGYVAKCGGTAQPCRPAC